MTKSEIYNPNTLTNMRKCDRLYVWLAKRLPYRLLWFCVIELWAIYDSIMKQHPDSWIPRSYVTVLELIHRTDETRFDQWEEE